MQQIPPIGEDKVFERFACDLFNHLESTNTFKSFGRSGHKQKGIDVFSVEKNIVIQCKKKDITRKNAILKKELLDDIFNDIDKIINQKLSIKFDKIFFVSTFKDDPEIDEYCEALKDDKKLNFEIIYWGWDTIQRQIIDIRWILEKYYKNFIISISSQEEQLKKSLDLKRRIEREFGDWLSRFPKDRERNSKMILRAFDSSQYPDSNNSDQYGEYSWFRAEIKGLYHKGMEFIYEINTIKVDNKGFWTDKDVHLNDEYTKIKVAKIGQINFTDIIDYDINGDEHYICPHIYCKFRHKGLPFEESYYMSIEDNKFPMYFESDKKIKLSIEKNNDNVS